MRHRDPGRPACKVEGCPNAASPKGSFCSSKHYYLLKKELAGGELKLPAPHAQDFGIVTSPHKHHAEPRPDRSECHTPAPEADPQRDRPVVAVDVTFRLTEQQCDTIWGRCNPGQKATALSSLLHQLLAI